MADGNLIYSKIIFQANVFDDKDPLMLGRIRASAQTDNVQAIYNGIPDWDPVEGPWSTKDPFVFLPLLPYFVSQTPKETELVQIIYQNPKVQYSNQFYIQGPFSSPMLTSRQDNQGANSMLGTGIQYQQYPSIKNKFTGTYEDSRSAGIFPEPGDNGFLGRGNADLIVKKNEVLLRAGKTFSTNPRELPVAYNGRAFVQLSQFTQTKRQNGFKKYRKLNEIVLPVKYLIEYTLYNPENQANVFNGEINIYTFNGSTLTNDEFSISKEYGDTVLKEIVKIENLSMQDVILKINGVLEAYNNNDDTPFFFRPAETISQYISTSSSASTVNIGPQVDPTVTNVSFLYTQVKPNASASVRGSGLVFFKNAYGQQYSPEKVVEPIIEYTQTPQSIGAIGADVLYLLSHKAQIPGKQIINLDGTLYGISQDKFSDDLLNSTSSSVRGEELLKLLSLIVKFLVGHTHPYHQMPPTSIATNGTSVPDILQEIQQGAQKILNSNIRIN